MPNVSYEIIQAAILGLEVKKQSIAAKIAQLRHMQHNGGSTAPVNKRSDATAHRAKPRKISAASRRRMAAAQRRRWAAVRKKVGEPRVAAPAVKKSRLSPAGRRRIIEATKRRWAAIRLGKTKAAR
jgi:hypothetical protein